MCVYKCACGLVTEEREGEKELMLEKVGTQSCGWTQYSFSTPQRLVDELVFILPSAGLLVRNAKYCERHMSVGGCYSGDEFSCPQCGSEGTAESTLVKKQGLDESVLFKRKGVLQLCR